MIDVSSFNIISRMLELSDISTIPHNLIDIGCADGHYGSNSYNLIKDFGWNAFLIDPLKRKYQKDLEVHYSNNINVKIIYSAISDHDGEIDIYHHSNDGEIGGHGSSLLNFHPVPKTHQIIEKVSVISYKTLCNLINFTDIGLISIDTEGYDFNILTGLYKELNFLPPVVISEDISNWNKNKEIKRQEFMKSLNYYSERISDNWLFILSERCNSG